VTDSDKMELHNEINYGCKKFNGTGFLWGIIMIISSSSNSNEIECFDCKVICLCLSSADYVVQTRENANKSLLAKTFIDSLKNSRN
jgi:hypothetical protein